MRIELQKVLEVVRFAHHPLETSLENSALRHDHHELIYVVSGSYAVQLPHAYWDSTPGDVFCYPAGTAHAGRMSYADPTVIYIVQWHPQVGETWPRSPRRVHDADGRLLALLGWMEELSPPMSPGEEHRRAVLLCALLSEMRAADESPRTPTGPIARVRRMMETRYQLRDLTLTYFCQLVGLSSSQLCRRFRAETGVSPMQYLRQVRVRAAIALLRRTDSPLRVIAAETGFCDVPHLCHEITRACGRPPGAIRAEARGKGQ